MIVIYDSLLCAQFYCNTEISIKYCLGLGVQHSGRALALYIVRPWLNPQHHKKKGCGGRIPEIPEKEYLGDWFKSPSTSVVTS